MTQPTSHAFVDLTELSPREVELLLANADAAAEALDAVDGVHFVDGFEAALDVVADAQNTRPANPYI